jgi:hypothetical protein
MTIGRMASLSLGLKDEMSPNVWCPARDAGEGGQSPGGVAVREGAIDATISCAVMT